MRVLAVDWSGKDKRPEESLWLAEVSGGELVSLENGRSREELIAHLIESARATPRLVVGIDFAFSFPKWWCDGNGWREVGDVWAAMAADGERLLAACEPPFWGRPGKPNRNVPERRYRRGEKVDTPTAQSVFQIGGSGAVGTGSIRGMALLSRLVEHGFSIWPFRPAGFPLVLEIYPRALTGPVNKSRWRSRHRYMYERFPEQSPELLERAAGCEDAFDAAVSALVMDAHAAELAALRPAADEVAAIEGRVWLPQRADAAAQAASPSGLASTTP
jgi:predicted nuclease with RNAse H fold